MSATVVGTTTRRSLHHFYRHDRGRRRAATIGAIQMSPTQRRATRWWERKSSSCASCGRGRWEGAMQAISV